MNSDIINDFLPQIAPMLLQVCISGALLVALMTYFAYIRPARARKKAEQETQQTAAPAYAGAGGGWPESSDLPDLDMLLDDVPAVRSTPPGVYAVELNTGASTTAREVLAILRDENDGRLLVQVDGVSYYSLAGAGEAKKLFVKTMKELSEVVLQPDAGAPAETPPAEAATAPPAAAEADTAPGEEPAPAPEPPAFKSAPPPPLPDGQIPGALPSFTLEDNKPKPAKKGLFGLGRPKYEFEPVPEVDIASAIEDYLQYKLRHTPEFADHDLHVRSAPGGGVTIQVNDRFYNAVDDIEDPTIRAFMLQTIQEWQERS